MNVILRLLPALLAAGSARAEIEPQAQPQVGPPAPTQPAPRLTKAPTVVESAVPAYPPELAAQDASGEAVLLVDVDVLGQVERVEIVSATHPAFGDAALVAATRLVFSPAEVDGRPAPIRIEYRYEFSPEALIPDVVAGEVGAIDDAPVAVSGVVREAGTRRALAGAVVEVGEAAVAETDAEGRFAVRGVPAGKHTVRATSRNHEPYATQAEIRNGERLEVVYYLVRRSGDPFETVVLTRTARQEVSRVQLDRREVRRVPGTFGDPVRVIENLPGMARTPGGLGGALLVRGTPPEDSLVFIDGVEVPLLYHFGGLTSVVNAEFLDRIDFFPGGFGVRYGRATGGVVDVQSRDSACDDWRGVAEITLSLSSAYVCAPAGDWAVAAAARRSYIDLLLPLVLARVPSEEGQGRVTASPVFWDYQVKASTRPAAHAVDIFAFGSDDRLKLIQTGSAEGLNFNFGLNLAFHRLHARDRWQIGPRTTLTSSLAPGFSRQAFRQVASEIDTESDFQLDIWTLEWREELTHEVSDQLTLRAGLDNGIGRAILELDLPFATELRRFPSSTFDYTATQHYETDIDVYRQGYWVEAQVTPTPQVKLIGGLRFDRHDFHHTQDYSLGPRAAARWEVVPGSTAKAAYGWYEKLPGPEYLLEGIGNPNLSPERAHHFIVGFEQRLTDLIDLDVQAFYNLRQRLRAPSDRVIYSGMRAVPEVWNNDGDGRTYGLEVLLRHLSTPDGRFYGWVAYTLSRSLQRDGQPDPSVELQSAGSRIDDGRTREYLVDFDQTHILTIVGQWVLPWWGLEAGFRFRLTSGNPTTPLDQGRVYFDADADGYGVDLSTVDRNSSRLPTFDQLDLRIDKNFTMDLWKLTVFLEVINLYNAENVEAFQYDYRYRERTPISLLPVLPILGVRGEF